MNGDEQNEVFTQMRIAIGRLETSIEKDIASLSREVNLRFAQNDKEIKLQADEYAVHLAKLNHEAEQLKKMQSTYVPRETHMLMEDKVSALELFKERTQGEKAWSNVIAIIATIIAIASVIVNIIK